MSFSRLVRFWRSLPWDYILQSLQKRMGNMYCKMRLCRTHKLPTQLAYKIWHCSRSLRTHIIAETSEDKPSAETLTILLRDGLQAPILSPSNILPTQPSRRHNPPTNRQCKRSKRLHWTISCPQPPRSFLRKTIKNVVGCLWKPSFGTC